MSKGRLILGVAALTWTAVTALVALLSVGYGIITAQDRFTEDSSLAAQAINTRLYEVMETIQGAAFYWHDRGLGRDDFRMLADALIADHDYVRELRYFPRVREAERAGFEQLRQDEGFVTFSIRDWVGGAPLAAEFGPSYYPLILVEPFNPRSAGLLGRDAATLACLDEPIEAVLSHGAVSAVEDCLSSEPGGALWLLHPLFAGRDLPTDADAYRRQMRGILALRFSPAALFAGIQPPSGLRYRILSPAGTPLFGAGDLPSGLILSNLTRRISLPLGDSSLSVHFERPLLLAELLRFRGALSLTAGLIVAVLAALLSANQWERRRAQEALRRHRDHLEEAVARRTRELSEANAKLHTEVAERRRAEQELTQLAIRDPLTGLYNRREMERRLDEEIERCRRYQHPLTIVMLDIDHFKQVNDTHGHRVGDEVLRSVAARLERALRRADFVARYGGEEFLAILPDTAQTPAAELAERIRNDLAQAMITLVDGVPLRVTASFGVASFPPHGADRETLCERADRALYRAKAAGRNRVVCVGPEEVVGPAAP